MYCAPWLDSGYSHLSRHLSRYQMILFHPVTGDSDTDHWVNMMSTRIRFCKVTFSPLQLISICGSECEVAQSCPSLWDPMDCSLPGSSVHGILQARILEWFAISFSRGSSQPRGRTQVSRIAGRCFTIWATREANVLFVFNLSLTVLASIDFLLQ